MLQASKDFLPALGGSFTPLCQVQCWTAGRLTATLPVTGGTLAVSAGQAVRSRLTLQIADPDGIYVPKPVAALNAWGSELVVRLGIDHGPIQELVQVGRFQVRSADTDEVWQVYPNGLQVSRGQVTDVEAVDLVQKVADEEFNVTVVPTQATVLKEIARILSGVVPWVPPSITDIPMPQGVSYSHDRLEALKALADLLDADPIATASGAVTLQRRTWPEHRSWVIPSSPGEDEGGNPVPGLRISMSRSLSRDGLTNAVYVQGTDFGGVPLVGSAYERTGPLAWAGPFGRVPEWIESPTVGTQAQADAAALSALKAMQAKRLQTMRVRCVWNPLLQVGDLVTLPAPGGNLDGMVTSTSLPLLGGPMDIDVSVDPLRLAEVT